jgi:D-alanyl-D-alanine carboxypeptidase (penicillin-binding protein 5/6)
MLLNQATGLFRVVRRTHRRRGGAAVLAVLSAVLTIGATPVPSPPAVEARAWLLRDHDSGRIIAEHGADERLEPASLTKMLTIYVVFSEMKAGKIGLDDQVLVSEKAWKMPGSRMFIEVDTRVPVAELIKGVIIQSGNDASVALAEHVAGDEAAFSDLMNQYAARIGLTGSHFVNASGLPHPEHYTTARDMARLASALIRDFPEHYPMHAQKEFVYNDITQYNRNKLLWQDASVDGLKTGHTESAGYCLVASAQRDGMRLVSVVMGTDGESSRARFSRALLSYGFRFFETHRLYEAGQRIHEVRVWKGERERVPLGLRQDLFVTVPRGQYQRLDPSMAVDVRLEAPLVKGQVLGELRVGFDGEFLVERPLVALESVREGSLWQRASDSVRLLFQ